MAGSISIPGSGLSYNPGTGTYTSTGGSTTGGATTGGTTGGGGTITPTPPPPSEPPKDLKKVETPEGTKLITGAPLVPPDQQAAQDEALKKALAGQPLTINELALVGYGATQRLPIEHAGGKYAYSWYEGGVLHTTGTTSAAYEGRTTVTPGITGGLKEVTLYASPEGTGMPSASERFKILMSTGKIAREDYAKLGVMAANEAVAEGYKARAEALAHPELATIEQLYLRLPQSNTTLGYDLIELKEESARSKQLRQQQEDYAASMPSGKHFGLGLGYRFEKAISEPATKPTLETIITNPMAIHKIFGEEGKGYLRLTVGQVPTLVDVPVQAIKKTPEALGAFIQDPVKFTGEGGAFVLRQVGAQTLYMAGLPFEVAAGRPGALGELLGIGTMLLIGQSAAKEQKLQYVAAQEAAKATSKLYTPTSIEYVFTDVLGQRTEVTTIGMRRVSPLMGLKEGATTADTTLIIAGKGEPLIKYTGTTQLNPLTQFSIESVSRAKTTVDIGGIITSVKVEPTGLVSYTSSGAMKFKPYTPWADITEAQAGQRLISDISTSKQYAKGVLAEENLARLAENQLNIGYKLAKTYGEVPATEWQPTAATKPYTMPPLKQGGLERPPITQDITVPKAELGLIAKPEAAILKDIYATREASVVGARVNIMAPPATLELGEISVPGGIHYVVGKTTYGTIEIITARRGGGYFTNIPNYITPEVAIAKTPLKFTPANIKPDVGGKIITKAQATDAFIKGEELGKPLGTSQKIIDVAGKKQIDVYLSEAEGRYIIRTTKTPTTTPDISVSPGDYTTSAASAVEPLGMDYGYSFRLTHRLTALDKAISEFKPPPATATQFAPYGTTKTRLIFGKEYLGVEQYYGADRLPLPEGLMRLPKATGGGEVQLQATKGITAQAVTPFSQETIGALQADIYAAIKPSPPVILGVPISAPATRISIMDPVYEGVLSIPATVSGVKPIVVSTIINKQLEGRVPIVREIYPTITIPVTGEARIQLEQPIQTQAGLQIEKGLQIERGLEIERAVQIEKGLQIERVLQLNKTLQLQQTALLTPTITIKTPLELANLKPAGAIIPKTKKRKRFELTIPHLIGARSIYADLLSATISAAKYGKVTHPSLVMRPQLWAGEIIGRVPTVEMLKGQAVKKSNTFISNLIHKRKRR